MKLVGGDSGYVEHEQFVDDVVLAPSERVVVDVSFDRAGELALEHRTPERVYRLASIDVKPDAAPSLNKRFETLRTNADMDAERQRIAPYLDAAPHKHSRSSPRWTSTPRPARAPSPTPARCTRTSSTSSPATARSAA